VVGDYERALSAASQARAEAERKRDEWVTHLAELEAEPDAAALKAANPGTAQRRQAWSRGSPASAT
jgi:hypothetical protein